MIKKVGDSFVVSLRILDEFGLPVSTDSPFVLIKNRTNGKFYNGLTWQTDEHKFKMTYVANGIYTYEHYIADSGNLEVTAQSLLYPNIIKSEFITVVDKEAQMVVVKNKPIDLIYTSVSERAYVTIRRQDGLFYDGTDFVENESELGMTLLSENVFKFTFIPDSKAKFTILCNSKDIDAEKVAFIIESVDSEEDILPITVSNETIIGPDGSDTTVLDTVDKSPIKDVKITAFNSISKESSNSTFSNEDGTWKMILKPGKYFFTFEKDGYENTSIERMVV